MFPDQQRGLSSDDSRTKMRQASATVSGPTAGSAGPSRSRRCGSAAGAAALWWVLTAVASPGLALGAPGMSREEADAVIARTRQWVAGYLETLPNFTCRKTIRVFVVPAMRKPELRDWAIEIPKWVVSKRSRNNDESEWLVRMVKGGRESYEWVGGSKRGHGWGFFGHWLKALFGEEYNTEFQWVEAARLRGYGVHVFRTVTPRNFCQYGRPAEDNVVLVGFRGKIYIDRDSGRVLRYVAEEPIGLPKRHRVKSGRMLFDYDYREIGDEVALLPVRSLVYTRYRGGSTLAESSFHQYREFQAETRLDFEGQ